jgi:hypothetical protein
MEVSTLSNACKYPILNNLFMIKITNLSFIFIFLILLSSACKKSGPTEDSEKEQETKQEPLDNTGTSLDSYINDAKYLYIRGINSDPNHPDYDKVELNNSAINKIFGYFKAVNALNSPQTDSIFNLYKMKIYHRISLSSLTFAVIPSKPGIDNLINGKIPTGNKGLDDIFNQGGFNKSTKFQLLSTPLITISSPKELNMFAIERQLKKREEILYTSSPDGIAGDGDRMSLTYRGETAILSFFRGWGDCPAGCAFDKPWVFEITNGLAVYKGKLTSRPPSP